MDANRIVAAVIAGRKRWGKSYGTGSFTVDDILDALVEQHEAGEIVAEDHSEELVREKRRVTAAKARYGKLQKQILEQGQIAAVNVTGDPDEAKSVTTTRQAVSAIQAEREAGISANNMLNALYAAGVDNWEGYEIAQDSLEG